VRREREGKRQDRNGICHDDPVMGQLRAVSGEAPTRRFVSRHLRARVTAAVRGFAITLIPAFFILRLVLASRAEAMAGEK